MVTEKRNTWYTFCRWQVLELGTRACPRHGPLYRTWGQIEFQAGNTADARKVFDRGLQACPTYDRLYYDFGDMEATMVRLLFFFQHPLKIEAETRS